MTQIKNFDSTGDVVITILVDNRADLIVESSETVKYFGDEPLLAEHGFSALVELRRAGIKILWDAGVTRVALMENMRRMKIDPASIDKIALSHGHDDHTASVTDVLAAIYAPPQHREWADGVDFEALHSHLEQGRVPTIAHPAAFRERWGVKKDGTYVGPFLPPPRAEWEAAGADIILSEQPFELGPGCWTTGQIPRRSFEKSGRPTTLRYRQGQQFQADDLEEDQAIVINVQGKGLVVLSGCAHSGIVNTLDYARQISGVERVWAVLGGFHLARAEEEELQQTVRAVAQLQPALIVPSHCTGFKAMCRFAAQFPEVFLPGVVGAAYSF
ncbi:MAG: MBL fold metallo-hydrolase [Chloroflexota bacterium]